MTNYWFLFFNGSLCLYTRFRWVLILRFLRDIICISINLKSYQEVIIRVAVALRTQIHEKL